MLVSLAIPEAAVPAPGAQAAAPSASAHDMQTFQSLMAAAAPPSSAAGSSGSGVQGVMGDYAQSMSNKFSAWRQEWSNFGTHLDLNHHASAVRVLEQQARLSSQSVEFQFALQSADSVRHAFKTLYQQQA